MRVDDPENCYEYEIWGLAPVQGFGKVLGRDLYFRARHQHWSFEVADHLGNLPSDGRASEDGFYREGKYPLASYMPVYQAIEIIDRCLKEYLGLPS
jgi:hypothetical protein